MKVVGRPPKYTDIEEFEQKIDEYFESRKGEVARDENGNIVFNKYGGICYIKEPRPPTITGLALYLGFNSKQTFYNYGEKKRFMESVNRARMRIEEYAEEQLYSREGQRGAEFNLKYNFGWKSAEIAKAESAIEQTKIIDDV